MARGIRSVDKITPFVKIGVYGPNGSGKTRFGASFPRCLIIDINEEGTRSAVGTKSHVREIDDFDSVNLLYWYLKAGNHPYHSVVIDTVTALYTVALDKVMGEKADRNPGEEKAQPRIQDYGTAGRLVGGMLLAFRNLPMHVIFLAQERKIKDEETGAVTEITMDLPARARGTATDCTSILGRSFKREVRRRVGGKTKKEYMFHILWGDRAPYLTKDRSYNLPLVALKPTGADVIRAWHNHRSEAQ
jgi:hypothetical protein